MTPDPADMLIAHFLGPKVKVIRPADLVPPGTQIPLFIGPCFHCGQGMVHQLPHTCPSCGSYLTAIAPPEITTAGPRMKRLWLWLFRWQQVLEDILHVAGGKPGWLSSTGATGTNRP